MFTPQNPSDSIDAVRATEIETQISQNRAAVTARVVDEKNALDQKLLRLNAFLKGETFNQIEAPEQDRLVHQAEMMQIYSNILGERIQFMKGHAA